MKFRKKSIFSFVLVFFCAILLYIKLRIRNKDHTYTAEEQELVVTLGQVQNEPLRVGSLEQQAPNQYEIQDYMNSSAAFINITFAMTMVAPDMETSYQPKKSKSFDDLIKLSPDKISMSDKLPSPSVGTIQKFGVLLVIYPNMNSDYYYRKIYDQARKLREVEPEIKICLVGPSIDERKLNILRMVVDRFEQISDDIEANSLFTLSNALKLSPYKITIYFDQDTIICNSFISDILPFFENSNLDMVFSGISQSRHLSRLGDADLGVIMFRDKQNVIRLLDDCIQIMSRLGENEKYDNQYSALNEAIYNHRFNIKLGRLSPLFGGSFRPSSEIQLHPRTKYSHYHTLVMAGHARFFQMRGHGYIFNAEVCEYINSNRQPRIVIWDKVKHPQIKAYNLGNSLELAYSQQECDQLLGKKCFDISWESQKHIRMLDVGPKKNANRNKIGLIYSVLDLDDKKFKGTMKNTLNSVLSVRNSEEDVDITLISNNLFPDTISRVSGMFDDFILINNTVQNFIDLLPNLSEIVPYEYIVFMDSDTFACSNFLKDLLQIMKTAKLDLALTGNFLKSNASFHFETAIAIYKNNQKVSRYVHKISQAINNISQTDSRNVSFRNQLIENSLAHAHSPVGSSNLKVGRLSPNFGIRWQIPLTKFNSFEESLLFNGTIRLIRGPETKSFSHHDLCERLNSDTSTRALLRTSDLKNILVVSSPEKYKSEMHKNIDWEPEPQVIIIE